MNNKLANLNKYLMSSNFPKEAREVAVLLKVAGKLSDALKGYPDMSAQIKELHAGVKSGNFNWSLEELVDGNADAKEIARVVSKFEAIKKNLKKRDINQYYSINQLRKIVDAYKTVADERQEKHDRKIRESDIIYEDEEYRIVLPKTEFASCAWTGHNTKWCISADETENMFKSYSLNNTFLFHVESRSRKSDDPFKRIAIPTMGDKGIAEFELRDSLDNHISMNIVKEALGDKADLILSKILEYAANKKFTDQISGREREAAEKIDAGGKVSSGDVRRILEIISKSTSMKNYWSALLLDGLRDNPNLVKTILLLSTGEKVSLSAALMDYIDAMDDSLTWLKNAVMETNSAMDLDAFILQNFEVSDSLTISVIKEHMTSYIDNLKYHIETFFNILIDSSAGQEIISDYFINEFSDLESGEIARHIKDPHLLNHIYFLDRIQEDPRVAETIGQALVDKGWLDREDLMRDMVKIEERAYSRG